MKKFRPAVSSVYSYYAKSPMSRGAFARRVFWSFIYIASFTFIGHLLWFYFVPAWLPLRRFLSGIPFMLLLLIPALGPRPLARFWLALLYPVLIIPAVICLEHIFMFHTPISSQSFYVIFETGIRESREFFTAQAGWDTILCAIVMLAIPLAPLRKLWRQPMRFGRREVCGMAVCLVAAVALYAVYGERRVFRSHMAYDFMASYCDYTRNKARLEEFVARSGDILFPGVRNELPGDPARTIVVVIGESANRHHHALYGYHRPTNPELLAIKDELILFDNVISSHSQTIPTVREAMSFAGPEGLRLPLVNLFRQAGFETIWISNQISFENFYTEIAVLVSTADEKIHLNRGGDQSYIRNYDEVTLPAFEAVLRKKAPQSGKRVIFVHLMGSHLNYASRYPKDFEFFTNADDIPDAPWRNAKSKTFINKYDNSIRYTDHVLSRMIALLKKNVENAALVYFSDHGEEVYDSLAQRGHANALKSPYYFDIPFVVWLSEGYRGVLGEKAARWKTYTGRPAVNSMFPYAAADLAGIGMDDENKNSSVLSDGFAARPRDILDGNYDRAFPARPRNGGTLADGSPVVFP